LRERLRPGSFPLLLLAGALVYVLNALAIGSTLGAILVYVARLGLVIAGMYVLSAQRATAWLAVVLGTLDYALDFVMLPIDPRAARMFQDACAALFLGWILVVVMREVFRAAASESNAVLGALAGFLLILMIFTRIHGLVETLSPGAYGAGIGAASERSAAADMATFQYFSTITLTTVGFGDIVPVSLGARLVTGLEAIVGQFYVAVVIATLVGRAVAAKQGDGEA
jgi:voltage-gated potassium channel